MSGIADTQVLTFTLGDEDYCVDIDYVAEIAEGESMTAVPDSAPYVEGVMDLRGRTTTIINLCKVLDTDGVDAGELLTDGGVEQNRIVVLDSETDDADSTTGWLVSDVQEVMAVSEDTFEAGAISETEILQGLIREGDSFTLWLDPHELPG
ncbi:chemotaxis protein CheW [Halobellus rarus]|uniref:Chemotaxis protein CheW n=1 Tax=Halobellus rarus TaxID=1126237 RepID=A0ABD6CPZ7_9EURY|nr:chemotaxis protein CheW [Halobellus rarus]